MMCMRIYDRNKQEAGKPEWKRIGTASSSSILLRTFLRIGLVGIDIQGRYRDDRLTSDPYGLTKKRSIEDERVVHTVKLPCPQHVVQLSQPSDFIGRR